MKRRFTESGWRKEQTFRSLCAAFLRCRTLDEMGSFLRDIATLSEMKALSERLDAARLLAQGLSYREVAETVKASTTTVSRVAAFLRNGTGYKNVLNVSTHHHHSPSLAGRGRGRS